MRSVILAFVATFSAALVLGWAWSGSVSPIEPGSVENTVPLPADAPKWSSAPLEWYEPPLPAPPVRNRVLDELDVMEAVYRHQFDHNASGGQRKVGYFFLSVGKRADPPADFIARFRDEVPTVVGVTNSTYRGNRAEHIHGGRGIIFEIEELKWIDADTAEVEGGYSEGGMSASGNSYRVQRVNDRWKVVKDVMKWIA